MEGINFHAVINVIAGQYLCYLAYKVYSISDAPENTLWLLRISSIAFVLIGIVLVVFGFRRIILDYKEYKSGTSSLEEDNEECS